MVWGSSSILLAIWVPIALGGLIAWAQRRRRRALTRFVQPKMQVRLLPETVTARGWFKTLALLAGLLCLILAAARPRWGVYYEKVTQRGFDVFILLDVSRSMLAEDVKPNRLERAKSDIRDLLSRLQGDRVGLIAFAGAPVIKVPLTTDTGFFDSSLELISPSSAPRGGSLIGDAIRKAVSSMQDTRNRDRAIVLITDGEDHDSFPEEAAAMAAEQQVKIFTVGLGDVTDGARIPSRGDSGALTFLQHKGQEVWSTMDEALLKKIALTTGGAYIPARTRVYDLGEIYDSHLAGLQSSELAATKRKKYREQFQLFVALGFCLLLVDMLLPVFRRRPADASVAISSEAVTVPVVSSEAVSAPVVSSG